MIDIEIWRTPISDGEPYEGYKVSNLGRILSLNYRNTGKPKLMTPENLKGYLRVELWKNGEYKRCFVHRIVAQTFLTNPENKPCVNHKIEGDVGKTLNMVIFNEDGSVDEERTTIEWATYEENNNYATRNERASETQINDPNKSKRVLQFTLDGEFVREWESTMEIQRQLGYNNANISACCRGKLKTAYGFRWEYK